LVRAERARLGLAHAAPSEPHTTSALADEWLVVQRRRSQDDPEACGHKRSRTEDHREALDDEAQDDSEARHGQAEDREARNREAEHREARRPQDHGAPSQRRTLDREAHNATQLLDPQEASLSHGGVLTEGTPWGVPSLVALPAPHAGLTPVVRLLAPPAELSAGFLLLLSLAHSYLSLDC
jgi:hypothetical protein